MFPYATTVMTRYAPLVTWSLIGINIAVFLFQVSLPPPLQEQFLHHFALVPALFFQPQLSLLGLEGGQFYPLLTNTFLHGGLLHLGFNMWSLYIFGPAVEDRVGSLRFLAFYLLCGIGASLAHTYANPNSVIPALGASGAIAGVMGAYMRLFPLSKMLVIIPIFFIPLFFEMHAAIFIGFWFLMQFMGVLNDMFTATGAGIIKGGIAWWAHIGGFVAGWLLIVLIRRPVHRYRNFYRDEGWHGFLPDGRRKGNGPWL